MPIEWVFFDMGGVLVDDQPAMLLFYRRLYEQCHSCGQINDYRELLSLREELIANGDGRHWVTAGRTLLGDDWGLLYEELIDEIRNKYTELNVPYPGMDEVLSWASGKFNTGLAANQLTECRTVLEKTGWVNKLKVLGISEEVGFKKPQTEFFRWLLDTTGASPQDCIMVGDRIDNDIAPAKALGLHTIWLRLQPDYDSLNLDDEFTQAYIESHKRANLIFIEPKEDSEQPDSIADTPEELKAAIEDIANGE